ncbi:hypothetical protein JOF53_005144 [Crossiella equi]|uniref:Uncharacterized protein n=1 Tax=Crossiella equi TaxID=130796 RepID=A0ABS5AI71_9PSEU|nr:hypothetical protein [Crossiella equi]MBP2476272.1 hypothetical protein [Crossiella equi]
MTTGDRLAGRMLPVRSELAAVLPGGGLRRGSTVAVRGSTALLFGLLATATAAGSWAAVVGLPGLGLVAASDAGVEVSRLALVPRPHRDSAAVAAALLDGLDLVALADPAALGPAQVRKLQVRARNRGSILLPLGDWPGADLQLSCVDTRWHGLADGTGYLEHQELLVETSGRGAAARPFRGWVGWRGPVAMADPFAGVDLPTREVPEGPGPFERQRHLVAVPAAG